jgi:UDP-glucose:(heptosyl)LPS alpha-1,3-glucosyltransferase
MWVSPYHLAQVATESRAFRSERMKLALAVSNRVRDELMRHFDLTPERVATLYNGIDLDRFRPAADPQWRLRVRQKLSVPRSSALVLFIGNGFARKGLGYLLEAWPQINGSPYLLIIGKDRNIDRYKRRARKLGIAERILFLGPRQDVELFLRVADVMALPSMFEPFGNAVMEAMASGCPPLTSIQTGAAELLPRELRRYTVEDPTNPGEISARLEALINSPPEFSELARATSELFTWDRYGTNLLSLLESSA